MTTHFIWDYANDSYLMEMDETGTTTAIYSNEPVRNGKLISQRRGSTTSYYHFDGQGSTRQVTNQNQNVTDEYTYSAFGETVATSGATLNSFQFIGKVGYYVDTETATFYVRARTYDSAIGRWKSEDPYGIASLQRDFAGAADFDNFINVYIYAFASPITKTDPRGHAQLQQVAFLQPPKLPPPPDVPRIFPDPPSPYKCIKEFETVFKETDDCSVCALRACLVITVQGPPMKKVVACVACSRDKACPAITQFYKCFPWHYDCFPARVPGPLRRIMVIICQCTLRTEFLPSDRI